LPPPPAKGPDPAILGAWGLAVGDPDAALCLPRWLREGAPLGITRPVDIMGVFPTVTDAEPRDPGSLWSSGAGWTNYASAEDQPDVVDELLRTQEDRGHCRFFDTEQDLLRFLGVSSVVLSKVGLISKMRADGTYKHRLIWDLLRSLVNESVAIGERIVLPRLQDAVEDALRLLAGNPGQHLEWLVLDVMDAFHNIPVHPSEWRFACGKVGGRYVLFLVLCMGGKSAPGIWGRYAAALGRLVASVSDPQRLALEVYVDDPLFCTVGTLAQRNEALAVALLTLAVTNFPLAWPKAVLGDRVVWIGAQLARVPNGVEVAVPAEKSAEVRGKADELATRTLVSRREVRKFCGLLSFFAGFLPALRPFLAMFWAALSAPPTGRLLPEGLIHRRRMDAAMAWIQALFAEIHGPLHRVFHLEAAVDDVDTYLATDASPWGMGGIWVVRGVVTAWFATPIEDADLCRFGAKRGDSAFNTTWEALALLIACRLWLGAGDGRGSPLAAAGPAVAARVRSDSLSALRSVVKLSSSAPGLNLIARELALDAVLGLYAVGVATHIPGVSNLLPDALSRLWAPDPKGFPPVLRGVWESVAPRRGADFWRTVLPRHRGGHRGRR
jgi:hypothetical protein